MIRLARQLAADLGLGAKARYLQGDFVAAANDIPRADVVVLDKVVCCYDDLIPLLEASLDKALHVYALSYPRARRLNCWGFSLLAVVGRILNWSFVPRWHDWEGMLLRIRARGFVEHYARDSFFWSVRVFQRA